MTEEKANELVRIISMIAEASALKVAHIIRGNSTAACQATETLLEAKQLLKDYLMETPYENHNSSSNNIQDR